MTSIAIFGKHISSTRHGNKIWRRQKYKVINRLRLDVKERVTREMVRLKIVVKQENRDIAIRAILEADVFGR